MTLKENTNTTLKTQSVNEKECSFLAVSRYQISHLEDLNVSLRQEDRGHTFPIGRSF